MECPILAIPNFFQSFDAKWFEKLQNAGMLVHLHYQHKDHLAHHHVVSIIQCTGFPHVEIVNIVCTTFVKKKSDVPNDFYVGSVNGPKSQHSEVFQTI